VASYHNSSQGKTKVRGEILRRELGEKRVLCKEKHVRRLEEGKRLLNYMRD